MKAIAHSLGRALLGALSVACLALTLSSGARAEEVNAETLVDRLQIQDLITRYYNNFGRENAENFADFYAEDAELILGERHFKGRNGIMEAYGRAPGQRRVRRRRRAIPSSWRSTIRSSSCTEATGRRPRSSSTPST